MRATIADLTAKMKRWSVRVALDDERMLAARGSPFALLNELLEGPRTTLLMVHTSGTHHFNALDQLSRLCAHQLVWSAVRKPSQHGVKQLVVYVPRFSSADKVAEEVQRLAKSIQIPIMVNVANCEDVPRFVLDALISSMLMHEMESTGCTIMGEGLNRQVVFSTDMSNGEIPTVALPEIQWQYDPCRRACSLEMTCVPVVMKLSTIAEDGKLSSQDDEDQPQQWPSSARVHVLPQLSEGWVISRFDQHDAQIAMKFVCGKDDYRHGNGTDLAQLWTSHDAAPGSPTDEEFRSYWLQVHGIRLPTAFGGYVRIRFSSTSILTYPACCVATEWHPLHKQTRIEALDILRGFGTLCRKLYGEQSVSLSSPDDQLQKTAVLLPASALLKAELADPIGDRQRTPIQPLTMTKRRMIARDRYTLS